MGVRGVDSYFVVEIVGVFFIYNFMGNVVEISGIRCG